MYNWKITKGYENQNNPKAEDFNIYGYIEVGRILGFDDDFSVKLSNPSRSASIFAMEDDNLTEKIIQKMIEIVDTEWENHFEKEDSLVFNVTFNKLGLKVTYTYNFVFDNKDEACINVGIDVNRLGNPVPRKPNPPHIACHNSLW